MGNAAHHVFSIQWKVIQTMRCQRIVKHAYYKFPEFKVTSSNRPEPKEIQSIIIEGKEKAKNLHIKATGKKRKTFLVSVIKITSSNTGPRARATRMNRFVVKWCVRGI